MCIDISILIATRNRRSSLERQFKAFEEMDTEGLTFEILVVDNGSSDGTYEWLESMASRLPVKAVFEPRPGKNVALNRVFPEARGSLILFTDDDAIPVPGWLKEYQEALLRWPNQDIFCGPVDPLYPPGTPDVLRYPTFTYALVAYGLFLPDGKEGLIDWLPIGPNFAVRSTTLRSYRLCENIGPSDDPKYAMGSERELLQRLTARGEKSVYLPGANVSHIIRPEQITLAWLKGRAFRFGRYKARLEDRDESSVRLFGAPRYLWRRLVMTGMRSGLDQILHMPQRWQSAFTHKLVEGQIYEYLRN